MAKKDLAPGGQAVIEGVMMRYDEKLAIAVRLENGKIKVKKDKLKKNKHKFLKWPFIRGVVNLVQMLVVGMKALIWSANQFSDEKEELSSKHVFWLVFSAMLLAAGIFVALPYILTSLTGVKELKNPLLFNLIDGIIKTIFFVAYIWGISRMKDVRRLFEYHGAEHMAVHCYESGKKLTPENCMAHKTMHPRCGTSFIMFVFVVSIIVFSILPPAVLAIWPGFASFGVFLQKLIMLPLRILFIPVIAAIGYELLKLTARFQHNLIFKLFIFPGIAMQKITTKKPDKKQLEVAIKALKEVVD